MSAESKKIIKLYKEHARSFLKLVKSAQSLKESHVHKLRVEIKNMRAFVILIKAISKNKFKNTSFLNILAPAFKQAGRIRTNHLNIKLTRQFHSVLLIEFKNHLQEREEIASKNFLRKISKFDVPKFSKLHKKGIRQFKKLKTQHVKKEAIEFLRVHFAMVRSEQFDISDDKTLHGIRKKLKIIKSTGKILNESGIEHPFKKELEMVEVIYDKIGQWHDVIVFSEELEKFASGLVDQAAIQKVSAILMKLKKKGLHSKLQITRKLRAELN